MLDDNEEIFAEIFTEELRDAVEEGRKERKNKDSVLLERQKKQAMAILRGLPEKAKKAAFDGDDSVFVHDYMAVDSDDAAVAKYIKDFFSESKTVFEEETIGRGSYRIKLKI